MSRERDKVEDSGAIPLIHRQNESAGIEEIVDVKRQSTFAAYTVGSLRAIRRKKTPIQPLKAQLDSYDKIILMSPVWGNRPTPAVNSAIECIPPGKKVEIIMVSASGKSGGAVNGTKALLYGRGCEVTDYTDVKV
jgi:NAD(P)H-dependent FMN reductase